MIGQRTVYLCPPIHGQIFDHGKPLDHHPVHLWLSYDKEWNYETITDENGCFSFARQIFKTFKPQIFYGEERPLQHIYVEKGNHQYTVWYSGSPEYGMKEYKVVADKLAHIIGDIKDDKRKYFLSDEETELVIPTFSFCNLD